MRNLIFRIVLMLACMATPSAFAGDLHVDQHNAQGSLSWHDGSSVLGLRSAAAGGIVVTRVGTGGTWGLRQGDVILAVDGHPVRQVATLVDRLRASKPAAVAVRVRRGQAEQVLTVVSADYAQLIAPKPPAPPAPPTPPPAPPAPPPPPPPSGG
ncbi:MAG: PDZ domain-containing protein [Rhodanobacter sp.]